MDTNDLFKYGGVAVVAALVSAITVLGTLSFAGGEAASPLPISTHITRERSSMTPDEDRVVSAVEQANPAVVAITISRKMPVYKQSLKNYNPLGGEDPFGGFFGGMNIQVPVQEQIGMERRDIGGGSGFLVSPDGYIVTNKHVVSGDGDEFTVLTASGEKYPAKVIAKDPVLDLAIVKIQKKSIEKDKDFPFLIFADSSKTKLGQSVIVIGNALAEFHNTISTGILSGLSRSIDAGSAEGSEHLDQLMQTDAAINPGNSGGPVLDSSGHVIGVAVATAGGASNISFAILGNSAKSVFESVQKTGKISRPYLGVRYIPITDEIKKKNNLDIDYGVLVQRGDGKGEVAVVPGSPADKAGITENDIILSIDGKKIDADHPLASIVRDASVGQTVRVEMLRKGKEQTVPVTLDEYKNIQ